MGKNKMIIIALSPIILIILTLSIFKLKPITSYLLTFSTLIIILLMFSLLSPMEIITASYEGLLCALWPICILIFSALLLFNIAVGEKERDLLQHYFSSGKNDELTMLMIVLGIGSMLEGLAGFGISTIIPLSLMISSGHDALKSTRAILAAISIPTTFGSMGIPMTSLSSAIGMPMDGILKPTLAFGAVLILFLPVLTVFAYNGTFAIRRTIIADIAIISILYLASYTAAGFFMGQAFPAIMGGLSITIFIYRRNGMGKKSIRAISFSDIRSFIPIISSLIFLCIPSFCPPLGKMIGKAHITATFFSGNTPQQVTFQLINTPGMLILIGTLTGCIIIKKKIGEISSAAISTIIHNWKPMANMCLVLAISKLMNYSGMTAEIANELIGMTGRAFPFVAPFIGTIGSFITGTNTSANILFGPIQAQAAIDLSVSAGFLASFNALGASIGKIICPQNLILASSVTEEMNYGKVKPVFPIFIFYTLLSSTLCLIFAY